MAQMRYGLFVLIYGLIFGLFPTISNSKELKLSADTLPEEEEIELDENALEKKIKVRLGAAKVLAKVQPQDDDAAVVGKKGSSSSSSVTDSSVTESSASVTESSGENSVTESSSEESLSSYSTLDYVAVGVIGILVGAAIVLACITAFCRKKKKTEEYQSV